ncbi:hypothetical protein GCM10023079_25850 [Streptomyces chitinivorans]
MQMSAKEGASGRFRDASSVDAHLFGEVFPFDCRAVSLDAGLSVITLSGSAPISLSGHMLRVGGRPPTVGVHRGAAPPIR